jgi:murein DD-endopeptidase MepM/ murein hydrolase activator NlpD
MPVNLSVRPRRNRRRRILWLLGAVLIVGGLLVWQRGWWSQQALADLGQEVIEQAPVPIPNIPQVQSQPKKSTSAAVVLATSTVVDNPASEAFTAGLYSNQEEEIPWPNAGGRTQVEIYTVEDGDTLWSIAVKFELSLDTLRWSNPELERNPDVLAVGTELVILPVEGVYHIIEAGDDIETIAAKYGVAEDDITAYPPNGLYPPYELTPGEGLIVPFGSKEPVLPKPALYPEFPLAWPVAGHVTGGFEPDHPALDIGAPYGSTVYAADSGTITYAGWATDGYGYTLIIDHGDGRETWYNHLKGTLLEAGGFVFRGTPIAEVGSTGHSSGPHVHFELRLNGEPVDPSDYLPASPQ